MTSKTNGGTNRMNKRETDAKTPKSEKKRERPNTNKNHVKCGKKGHIF